MHACVCHSACGACLLATSNSAAVPAHSHTFLQMWGKLLRAQRPVAVGALTVDVLLQRLRSISKYIQPLGVYYVWCEWRGGERGEGRGRGGERWKREREEEGGGVEVRGREGGREEEE